MGEMVHQTGLQDKAEKSVHATRNRHVLFIGDWQQGRYSSSYKPVGKHSDDNGQFAHPCHYGIEMPSLVSVSISMRPV